MADDDISDSVDEVNESLTPKRKMPKREPVDPPKVFLDRACFLTSDGKCVQLCYIHLTEDLKEVEKSGGYYGTVRQALDGYVDRVLKGQPSKTVTQFQDLLEKINTNIEKVLPLVCDKLEKKNVPAPKIDAALGKADAEAKRKRSKIQTSKKEVKINSEQRGQMLRDLALQFSEVELAPGLKWRDTPDLLAKVILEGVYNYEQKADREAYKVPVILAARKYINTHFG